MTLVITFDEDNYLKIVHISTSCLRFGMITIFVDSDLDLVRSFFFDRTYFEMSD